MPPVLLARFAADWRRVWPDAQPVGLAVSGGPDSVALLILARAVLPGQFAVATVDHGLRPEATREAADVAALCAAWSLPHTTLTLAMPAGTALQERARIARYAALGQWLDRQGLSALVTAHHADDQAETLMMRLNRGAGLRGLAGMRATARVPEHGAALLRPLLGWRRAELVHLINAAGVGAADDPSNCDPRYERVRIRQGLGHANWIEAAGLAASAEHLAQADTALDWAAEQAWHTAIVTDAGALIWQPNGMPKALALRVLERIVLQVSGAAPRGSDLARWHDTLAAGKVATLAGVRGDGRADGWHFVRAPAHRQPLAIGSVRD